MRLISCFLTVMALAWASDAASITIKQDTVLSDVNSAEMLTFINQLGNQPVRGNIMVVESHDDDSSFDESSNEPSNEVINNLNFKSKHQHGHHNNMFDFSGSIVESGDQESLGWQESESSDVVVGPYKGFSHSIEAGSFDLSDLQSVDEDFLKANFYTAKEMADLLGSQAEFDTSSERHQTKTDEEDSMLQDLFKIDDIDVDTLFSDEDNSNDEKSANFLNDETEHLEPVHHSGVAEENEIANEFELEANETEDEKETLNESYFYPDEDEPAPAVGHYMAKVAEETTTTEETTTSTTTLSPLKQQQLANWEDTYNFLLGKRGTF